MKSNISQARISQEIRTMRKENLPYLKAEPLDDDIYNWHFTFLGPENSDFH
jgi:ubiquitin-protein ligase